MKSETAGKTSTIKPTSIEVDIDRTRFIRILVITCVVCEFLFVFLDYHINYAEGVSIGAIRRMFNATREDSLGSFFSVMQTALIGVTLWFVYALVRNQKTASRMTRWGWLLLAAFFTYLAIDDGSELHERIGTAFDVMSRRASDADEGGLLSSFPSYAWQIVFMPIFGSFGIFILFFLGRELKEVRQKILVVVALGCLVATVGLDFIEGLDRDHPLNLYTAIADTFDLEDYTESTFDESPFVALRHFSKTIEESLEMFAMTLFWSVFLGHLFSLANVVSIRFRTFTRKRN